MTALGPPRELADDGPPAVREFLSRESRTMTHRNKTAAPAPHRSAHPVARGGARERRASRHPDRRLWRRRDRPDRRGGRRDRRRRPVRAQGPGGAALQRFGLRSPIGAPRSPSAACGSAP
ncbi:MAG: hypothetical protein MZW92_26440 [Comamonadaceae bacterium]|nr:hypothetical protein [Comamonadaceae bacterium]